MKVQSDCALYVCIVLPNPALPSLPPRLIRMAPLNKKELPSKEKTLFKELLNLYESRQLKKGVKTADQILKKFPENGGAWFRIQSVHA